MERQSGPGGVCVCERGGGHQVEPCALYDPHLNTHLDIKEDFTLRWSLSAYADPCLHDLSAYLLTHGE